MSVLMPASQLKSCVTTTTSGRPQKKKVICAARPHGSGIASGSLTGLKAFHHRLPSIPSAYRAPHYLRAAEQHGMTEREFSAYCTDKLEAMILEEADTVAAFIGEPVLGTGGIVPPPEGYWEAIQPVLDKPTCC